MKEEPHNFAQHPDQEGTFYLASLYYAQTRQWKMLQNLCDENMKKHPDWAATHYFLSRIRQNELEDEAALLEYKKAYQLKPCWGQVQVEYTKLLLVANRAEEVLSITQQGLELCSHNDPDKEVDYVRHFLHFHRARAYLLLSDNKAAIKELEAALRVTPKIERNKTAIVLCDAYVRSKQWHKCIALATSELKTSDDMWCHFFRAKAYAGVGQYQKAVDDISIFIDKQPQLGTVEEGGRIHQVLEGKQMRAEYYEKMGRKDLATRERKAAGQESKALFDAVPEISRRKR